MISFTQGFAVAVTLAITSLPAFATTNPAADQRIDITAPRTATPSPQLTQPHRDTVFELPTGHRLAVASFGDIVQMRLGRRMASTLRHDGSGRFVSPDGKLVLRFELDAAGSPQRPLLSVPSDWL